MSQLLEVSRIGAITVGPDGAIEVRRDDCIMRDDAVVAGPTYHRHVLAPGDRLDAEDERVRAIAAAIWTEEVLTTYRARVAAEAVLFPSSS